MTRICDYLQKRWNNEEYIPLATEALGTYLFAFGAFAYVVGKFGSDTLVTSGRDFMKDGVSRVTYLPCTIASTGVDLSSRCIKTIKRSI